MCLSPSHPCPTSTPKGNRILPPPRGETSLGGRVLFIGPTTRNQKHANKTNIFHNQDGILIYGSPTSPLNAYFVIGACLEGKTNILPPPPLHFPVIPGCLSSDQRQGRSFVIRCPDHAVPGHRTVAARRRRSSTSRCPSHASGKKNTEIRTVQLPPKIIYNTMYFSWGRFSKGRIYFVHHLSVVFWVLAH